MVKKRFSGGFSLDAHYTLGRSIDDSTNEINNTDFPLIGRKLDRGPSDIDIRHMFVASYVYELPVGKGRRFLNRGGVSDAILGGWQVSGHHVVHVRAAGQSCAARKLAEYRQPNIGPPQLRLGSESKPFQR